MGEHRSRCSSDLVTGEDADAVSSQDIPEPDGAIGRPCDDIVGVGVETCGSDISEVTRKHPQGLVVVCCPQTERGSTTYTRLLYLKRHRSQN